jgi:hypothetical protein
MVLRTFLLNSLLNLTRRHQISVEKLKLISIFPRNQGAKSQMNFTPSTPHRNQEFGFLLNFVKVKNSEMIMRKVDP